MIMAVDTNVLLDIMRSGSPFTSQSRQWLAEAAELGSIIVCDVVYAELAPQFADRVELDDALREFNATPSPIDTEIAYEAGRRFLEYRRAGGPRRRIIADFLIGAHAALRAGAFLTRDEGFFRTYFPELNGGSYPDASERIR